MNTEENDLKSALAEIDKSNVIELARRMGPATLDFLRKVITDSYNDLGLEKSVPLSLRLMAADLIRKFAALPTNVQIGLQGPAQIIYTGDAEIRTNPPAEVIDVVSTARDTPALLRGEMATEPETMEGSPDD